MSLKYYHTPVLYVNRVSNATQYKNSFFSFTLIKMFLLKNNQDKETYIEEMCGLFKTIIPN